MSEGTLRDQLSQFSAGQDSFDEDPQEPTEEELKHNQVAAFGRAAPLPSGVTYQGPWEKRSDGLARHVRESARSLALYLPVHLIGIGGPLFLDEEIAPEVVNSVGYLRKTHCATYPFAVRHIVLSTPEHLAYTMCPSGARLTESWLQDRVYANSILYTSIERDRVSDDLVEGLNRVGQVWVPCEANRQAMITSGIDNKRIRVVPFPYDPATHPATQISYPRGSETVPKAKRFYTIAKWEPRKGLHELIGAFLLAFTPRDYACLTIKTFGWGKWKNYPSPEESGKFWIENAAVRSRGWTPKSMARLIQIIESDLTDQEIADLHAENNIYVSASHGEAWDIPAFDARCAGNSLVHVGYGGSDEYAGEGEPNCYRVPYQMGPAHQDYGWEPGSLWACWKIEDLLAALIEAEPPELRRHPPRFAPRFSHAAVGWLMREYIREMVSRETFEIMVQAGHYG